MSVGIGPLMSDEFTDVRVSLALIETLANGEYTNGQTYYVDGNAGDDLKDGLSWANAMRTVAVALAASHANIAASASGWASRNRIYIKGDAFEEDLTKLAQKTDVIGVGSYNQWMKPGIKGNHAINGTTWVGTRFFNIHFSTPVGGGDIFTLPATTRGIEFHDCLFDGTNTGTPPGGAIITAAVWFLTIKNCEFVGDWSDAIIEIGVGNAQGLVIENNYIEGDNQGIDVNASATTSPRKGLIKDNTFHTAVACINDASGVMAIIGNRGVTLAARGLLLAGAVVGSEELAIDNVFSCQDGSNIKWPLAVTLNPSGGRDYYVYDETGDDTNNGGGSWDDALATLGAALEDSHAWIGSGAAGWEARNRIFYKGDQSEDLTLLARKTDIIGVGSAGNFPQARLIGNHTIGAGEMIGIRFYNMHFMGGAGGGDIFTFADNSRSIEFHECYFSAASAVNANGAIITATVWFLKVVNCTFDGLFQDAVIEIGTGNCQGLLIKDNHIEGANQGIDISGSATASPARALIEGNSFRTNLECINDAADIASIVNNRAITLQAIGTLGAGVVVGDKNLSAGNWLTASDEANLQWPLNEAKGTAIVISKTIVSNTIPDDGGGTPQAAPLTGAASGDLYLDEIIMQTDAGTGLAGPTAVQVVCDNTDGLTGDDVPIWDEAVANLGAGKTINNNTADVNTLPIMLESGAKLYINGDDAVGTGGGTVEVIMKFRRATVGAIIAPA